MYFFDTVELNPASTSQSNELFRVHILLGSVAVVELPSPYLLAFSRPTHQPRRAKAIVLILRLLSMTFVVTAGKSDRDPIQAGILQGALWADSNLKD
jgi:hypothetical protein